MRVQLARRRRAFTASALAAAVLLVTAARMAPPAASIADAIMRGDTAQVRLLIRQGADVNAAQADGMTALHWAATRGDASVSKMLVAAGARVDAFTRNGNYTPLHLAAKSGRAEAVKVLLNAGADVKAATTTGGATALHFAAADGDPETVIALLDKGAPVDSRETAYAQTPLMWAASYNRVKAVNALLAHGANIEATSKIEDIAARERTDRSLLTARARRVAAIKAAEAPLTTPGAPGGAAFVANAIASADGAGSGGRGGVATQATGAAAPAGAPAMPTAAKATDAKPTDAKPTDATVARKAADAKPADPKTAETKPIVAAKQESGPLIGGTNGQPGDTTRAATGFSGRGPSYGELIGNKGGLTALLFAVREGNVESVDALLKAGAKINHVSDGDKTSPLLMATINGRFDMAKMLMEKGADVKLLSEAGASPLYSVINIQWAPKSLYPQPTAQLQQKTSYLELMEMMLKAGADVNVRLSKHLWYMSFNFDLLGVNTTGATPFWRAAYGTDVDAMKLLLKYGADPTIPTIKPSGRLPGDDAPDDDNGGKDPSGVPPIPAGGPGVYPLQAAAGVGYGEGFAANSHRHAPDGWLPSVKFLIEELHIDVNQRDFNGYNAIHHAAARGDTVLIAYLMSKGGDLQAISRKGQTTVDMANGPVQRVPPFEETVLYLERLGAKNSHKCKSC